MGCNCGGGANRTNMVYQVFLPDGTTEWAEDAGQLRILRSLHGIQMKAVQVPRAKMEEATADPLS